MKHNTQETETSEPPQTAVQPTRSPSNARSFSRRSFLAGAPKLLTGAAVGAGAFGGAPGLTGHAAADPALPWPYTPLDPEAVADRAYAAYALKGCMYGVFEGIIGELREQIGSPYTTFPAAMMEYGKGGINGVWGTLCGTMNGAAAAINLVSPDPAPLINEVFFWYSQELLPNYTPQNPNYDIVQSVSGSPICHVSVERWCETSGFAPTSPQRAERCGRLSASVAKYTVEMLNAQADASFSTTHQQLAETQRCMMCHEAAAPVKVHHGRNMSCAQCHTGIDAMHPQKHLQIRWTGSGPLEQSDAVTGPWTPAPNQANAQPLSLTKPMKFFRLK